MSLRDEFALPPCMSELKRSNLHNGLFFNCIQDFDVSCNAAAMITIGKKVTLTSNTKSESTHARIAMNTINQENATISIHAQTRYEVLKFCSTRGDEKTKHKG